MHCNTYPPWWVDTVTLYNKVTADGKILYYRHVFEDCFIAFEENEKSDSGNSGEGLTATVRIRANDKYLPSKGYADSGEAVQKTYFTVTPGDVIFVGTVDDEMADESGKRPHDLLEKYEGFFVSSFKDNSNAPPAHYKVLLK